MSEWKPIETSPKDGTPYLLGSKPDQWVAIGYFEIDRGWFELGTHWTDAYADTLNPTHWQSVPAPPQN